VVSGVTSTSSEPTDRRSSSSPPSASTTSRHARKRFSSCFSTMYAIMSWTGAWTALAVYRAISRVGPVCSTVPGARVTWAINGVDDGGTMRLEGESP